MAHVTAANRSHTIVMDVEAGLLTHVKFDAMVAMLGADNNVFHIGLLQTYTL